MATALTRGTTSPVSPIPEAGQPLTKGDAVVTAFQRSVRSVLIPTLSVAKPEGYHKQCVRESLISRYPDISKKLAFQLSTCQFTKRLNFIEMIAPSLTRDKIEAVEDLERDIHKVEQACLSFADLEWVHALVLMTYDSKKTLLNQDQACRDAFICMFYMLLFSIGRPENRAADGRVVFQPSVKDLEKYFQIISSPPFLELMEADWPLHMHLCEVLFDAVILRINTDTLGVGCLPPYLNRLVGQFFNFQKIIPDERKSDKYLSEQFSQEYKLLSAMKHYSEAFYKLEMSGRLGNQEAFFEAGLALLGLQGFMEQYTNPDKGLQFLQLTKSLMADNSHDSSRQRGEEQGFKDFTADYQCAPCAMSRVALEAILTCLKRYIGLDCCPNKKKAIQLAQTLGVVCPSGQSDIMCLIDFLEGKSPRRYIRSISNTINVHWIKGKSYELEGKLEHAFLEYRKLAAIAPFHAGWAPVRVALEMQRWPDALKYCNNLLQAWPEDYDVYQDGYDKEILLETIAELTELIDAGQRLKALSVDELVAGIEGSHIEEPRSHKKRKGKKKKKQTEWVKPQETTIEERVQRPVPISKDTIKVSPSRADLQIIAVAPVSDFDRKQYQKARQDIRLSTLKRHYGHAEKMINELPDTTNPVYQARKCQWLCWLKLRESEDTNQLLVKSGGQLRNCNALRAKLRGDVESMAIHALQSLLKLTEADIGTLYENPEEIRKTRKLPPEAASVAASLMSILGHCCSDTLRDHPSLGYLKETKKKFFDCADKTNPWRVIIKQGKELPPEALAAMNF